MNWGPKDPFDGAEWAKELEQLQAGAEKEAVDARPAGYEIRMLDSKQMKIAKAKIMATTVVAALVRDFANGFVLALGAVACLALFGIV